MSSFIEEINSSSIPAFLNTGNSLYQALIGNANFVPNPTIVQSSDYNCGALCNELEFARYTANYFVGAMNLAGAQADDLEYLINTFINLPRRGSVETDATYRLRFQSIIAGQNWTPRTTKQAIIEALSYFVPSSNISITEWFDTTNCEFQVRIEGTISFTDTTFYDYAYYDNSYYGGIGNGLVEPFVSELVQRIKAAGVQFTVLFVNANSTTLNMSIIVGSVIQTTTIAVVCKNSNSTTTTIAAVVA